MKSRAPRFNIYFMAALMLCAGCHTQSSRMAKEELSTLRLFLEGTSAEIAGQGVVQITRQKIPVTIQNEPFLSEEDITHASLVDLPDGTYDIQVAFNDHGALVLDMTTTAYKGKKIVVFSQFPKPSRSKKISSENNEATSYAMGNSSSENTNRTAAWLGAVVIRGRLGGGSLRFTPDASHAEAARIVRGLNNLAAEIARKTK